MLLEKYLSTYFFSLEPLLLIGEGEYNLNNLKQILVTDSFFGLESNIKHCQNKESLYNCTTRNHLHTILRQCGCLPFGFSNEDPVCSEKKKMCVETIKVDTQTCLKPCAGLIVTSYSEAEQKKNPEDLFPLYKVYNQYKGITSYNDYGYTGK